MLSKPWLRRARAQELAGDQRGVTAIVTGIALTVILGFAGLAIDIAAWLNATRGIQAAADQAAYSAASAAGVNGCNVAAAPTQARAIAAARGYTDGVNNTTVTVTCNASASTYTVRIDQLQPMWFAKLFLSTPPTASARAVAQLASQVSDLCVLALDGTNVSAAIIGSDTGAAGFIGNTTINLHCGIAVDSSSSSAMTVGGSASVTATDVYLVGDMAPPSGHGSLTTSPTPNNILRHQPPVVDPYLDRNFSTPISCTNPVGSRPFVPANGTVPAGTYCGGLTLGQAGGGHHDSYTLSGVYYIVGGELQINASANVIGTGVTFVLTGNALGQAGYATLRINGNSDVSLTAPTYGVFGGLVFFQDRNAPFSSNTNCGNGNAQNKINGGSNQLITGAIYFPNQSVCFTGNSSVSGPGQCTQLIARTLDFTGNSDIRFTCAGTGISPISVLVPQLIN